MRAIIADDEELARFSVRDMLGEISVQVTVVAEAKNGTELIESCRRLQPDVAIVDIRMPGMSGLDAIEASAESCKNTDWVILTSYPEFNYARRALRAGVVQYLLKPVAPSELEDAMLQVSERRRKRIEEENREFAARIGDVLSGEAEGTDDKFESGWSYVTAFACMDARRSTDDRKPAGVAFARILTEELTDFPSHSTRVAVLPSGKDYVAVLALRTEFLERGTDRSLLGRFENRLRQVASALSGEEGACTIVLSEATASGAAIARGIKELADLAPLRALAGVGLLHRARELHQLVALDAASDISGHLSAAATSAEELRPLALEHSVREAAQLLQGNSSLRIPGIERNVTRYLRTAVSAKAGPLASSDTWLPAVVDSLLTERRAREGDASGDDTVAQVKRYLEDHYAAGVSVSDIAASVGVTPNYLSALFHKHAGVTFRTYLTRLRMGKARTLLADGRMSVGEVAAAVGYTDARHFARVFKSMFGRYPSETRAHPGSRSLQA